MYERFKVLQKKATSFFSALQKSCKNTRMRKKTLNKVNGMSRNVRKIACFHKPIILTALLLHGYLYLDFIFFLYSL